jgi:iron complex outermembrane receptor protein
MSQHLKVVSLCAAALLATTSPVLSHADDSSAPSTQLESIVVTARRVTENVQNVPESMTVLTAATITEAGITSVSDVANLVPNMIFNTTPVPGGYNFTVRGISMAQGAEAPVAFVVDGVEVPDPLFINEELLDIDKIQVLRGPQGSLYGRNALAGAIIIDTQQPTNDFSGSAKLRYGNGDERYGNAILSGAIVPDQLLASLAASTNHFGGLIVNNFNGVKADSLDDNTYTGRLLYKPTSALTISVRANLMVLLDNVDTSEVVDHSQFENYGQSYLDENAQPYTQQRLLDTSLKVDYDFGSFTGTSITAYNSGKTDLSGDADFTPVPILLQDTKRNVDSRSEEVRLTSKESSSIKWVGGAFFQNRDTLNALLIPFDNGFGQPTVPPHYLIQSRDEGTSKSWALFGQSTFTVLPATDLTLGLRYDRDDRTSVDADVPGSAIAKDFDALQPKISLEYHWTPEWQSYATVARGFRSGGFNAYFSVGNPSRGYAGQTDLNYEVGFKGTFFNRILSIDGAVYHTAVDNQQLFFINTNPPSQNVTTIDKTSINGGELEIAAQLAPGFRITAGVGIADSRIDSFALTPSAVGDAVPLSPTYTATLSANYLHLIGNGWAFTPYVGINRRGPIYWDALNTLSTPPKDLLDLRLPFQSDHFFIAPYAKNLLNEQYPLGASVNGFGPDRNGRFLSEPRTYGIEVGGKF